MTRISCKYCNNTFNRLSALNYHQKNTKYCLIKQKEIMAISTLSILNEDDHYSDSPDKSSNDIHESESYCKFCNLILLEEDLNSHIDTCSKLEEIINFEQQIIQVNNKLENIINIIQERLPKQEKNQKNQKKNNSSQFAIKTLIILSSLANIAYLASLSFFHTPNVFSPCNDIYKNISSSALSL